MTLLVDIQDHLISSKRNNGILRNVKEQRKKRDTKQKKPNHVKMENYCVLVALLKNEVHIENMLKMRIQHLF